MFPPRFIAHVQDRYRRKRDKVESWERFASKEEEAQDSVTVEGEDDNRLYGRVRHVPDLPEPWDKVADTYEESEEVDGYRYDKFDEEVEAVEESVPAPEVDAKDCHYAAPPNSVVKRFWNHVITALSQPVTLTLSQLGSGSGVDPSFSPFRTTRCISSRCAA